MKWVLALGLAALVAGCGADGAPEPPEGGAKLKVSGDARFGVVTRL